MANATGTVRLRLFKGQATVLSRNAPASLYDLDLASFGASDGYAHSDSSGFVKLFSLPQRAMAAQEMQAAGRVAHPRPGEPHGATRPVWRPAGEPVHTHAD